MPIDYRLRPVRVPDDYDRLAALLNRIDPSRAVTVEALHNEDRYIPTEENLSFDTTSLLIGHGRERVLAVDEAGRAIGFGIVWRAPWTPPGSLASMSAVDPVYRRRGVGTALREHIESWGRQRGANSLGAEAADHPVDYVAFAQKRGYAIDAHVYTSSLDLAAFNEDRFIGAVERAHDFGIRFFTLADDPSEQAESKLYALYRDTLRDNPGHVGDLEDVDSWRREAIDESKTRKDWVLIAADGDRFVGVTTMFPTDEPAVAYTHYTGVDRTYRGRGLGLALKLLSFRAAREFGVTAMSTETEAGNVPILTINRKLGYVPGPGRYRVIKQL